VAARRGTPGTRNRVHIVLGRAKHRVPSQPLIGLRFGSWSPELVGAAHATGGVVVRLTLCTALA
jgi:hypothetical protein